MPVVKDTYVLDAQTPDFRGLKGSVDDYIARLTKLESATQKALGDPKAMRLTQQEIEKLVQKLKNIQEVRDQISNNKASILGGKSNIDLSKTTAAVADLRQEVLRLQSTLASSGRKSTADLFTSVGDAARSAGGRGIRLAVAGKVGGAEQLGRNQLDDAQNARALSGLKSNVGDSAAVSKAARVARLLNLDKLAGDSATFEKVLQKMAEAAANGTTTLVGLGRTAKAYVVELKATEAATEKALASIKAKEATDARVAAMAEAQIERQRRERTAIIELRRELQANAKASQDAATAVGALSGRFNALGGDRAAKALQELTESFAKNKTTAQQRIQISNELIAKYEAEAKASEKLSGAVNKEGIERARLRAEAAKAVGAEITLGRLSDKQGGRAIQDVGKRIESGELRTTLQVQQAVTAEIAKQRELERAITLENKLQTSLTIQQKEQEAVLTGELAKQAKTLGFTKQLHGDMRSVVAQTVSEAQRLGLTYAKNKAEVDALLKANVELKKLQIEAGPKQLNQFGVAFAAGFASQQIIQGLSQVINRFSEFEDELIKVRRTADASRETMKNLGAEILDIGQRVPIAAKSLAAAAGVLGQTGAIQFADGKDFARTSAEIRDAAKAIELVAQISLVAELNIEQAATSYGQFAVVFSKDITRITEKLKEMGVEGASTSDAMRVLFGSINEVGNKTVATTEDLLTFIRQFGGTAASFGITAEKVTALGGAVRDAGAHADVAGTAFVRFFSRATQDAAEFGKVLDISGDAFRAKFSADALGTIIEVFKRLGKESKTNKLAVTDFLRSLKVESREQGVFTKLIDNYEILSSRLEFGQNVAENYNSVQEESAKRSETWSASITKLSNAFQALVNQLAPALALISKVVDAFSTLLTFIASQSITTFAVSIGVVGAALAAALLTVIKIKAQFDLAVSSIQAMTREMELFNLTSSKGGPAPTSKTAPPTKGGGGKGAAIAGGIAAAAAAASLGTALFFSASDAKTKGLEAGEGYIEGVKESLKEGDASKEAESFWSTLSVDTILLGITTLASSLAVIIPLVSSLGATLLPVGATIAGVAAAAAAFVATWVVLPLVVAKVYYEVGRLIGDFLGLFSDFFGESARVERQQELLARREADLNEIRKVSAATQEKLTRKFVEYGEVIANSAKVTDAMALAWEHVADAATGVEKKVEDVADVLKALMQSKDLKDFLDLQEKLGNIRKSDTKVVEDEKASARKAFIDASKELDALTGIKSDDSFARKLLDPDEAEKAIKELTARAEKALERARATLKNVSKRRLGVARLLDKYPDDSRLQETFQLEAKTLATLQGRTAGRVQALKKLTEDLTGSYSVQYNKVVEGEARTRAAMLKTEKATEEKKAQVIAQAKEALFESRDKLDGMIDGLGGDLEKNTDKVTGKFYEAYLEGLKQIEKIGLDAIASGLSQDGALAITNQATERFREAWAKGLGQAWSDAAKKDLKDAFTELKQAVDDYFDEIEVAAKERRSTLVKLETVHTKDLADLQIRREAWELYGKSIAKVHNTLKVYDELNRSTFRGVELEGVQAIDSIDTMMEKLILSTVEYADTWELVELDAKEVFSQIRKAIEDTKKAISQLAFDSGRKAGAESFRVQDRDKDVTKTLRQSSTARSLISDIKGIERKGGTDAEVGAKIQFAVEKAKDKFGEQGIDASAFFEKLDGELNKRKLGGKDEQTTLKDTVAKVGEETNAHLTNIEALLKGTDTSQIGGVARSQATGTAVEDFPMGRTYTRTKPTSPSVLSTAQAGRNAVNQIADIDSRSSNKRRTIAENRKIEEERTAIEAALRAKAQQAIDSTINASSIDKTDGKITPQQVKQVQEAFRKLILESPELKGFRNKVGGKGITDITKQIDVKSLQMVSDEIQGKINTRTEELPAKDRLAKSLEGATEASKGFNASVSALTLAVEGAFKNLNIPALKAQLDGATKTVNAATGAAGN